MSNWIGIIIIVAMFAFVGLFGFIRIAPSDPATWHIDPTDPALSAGSGSALVRADGSLQSPDFALAPEALLEQFNEIADAAPRTRVIAGSPAEGRVTYLTRSLIFGFPDYTTVTAIPVGEGSQLVAYGRLRFGSSDLGVNQERLEGWLAQMEAAAGS